MWRPRLGNDCQFDSVLEDFKIATEVLSGFKYPTNAMISLVLLFRAEIIAALHNLSTDNAMVMSVKQRMRQAVNHRLPVTELNVYLQH